MAKLVRSRDRNTNSLEDVIVQVPRVIVVDNDPQIRSGSGFSFGAGKSPWMRCYRTHAAKSQI